MRKYYPVFFIAVLLISCTVNSQPGQSISWRKIGDGIAFGISGIALFDTDNDRSNFVLVHDNKKPDENRLGIVSVSSDESPKYLPLTWPNDTEIPKDLEAIDKVPGTNAGSFMAATSKGKIYHFTVESDRNISILKVFDLPEFPKKSNFEGLALQEIDGQLLMVWTHRGQDSDPGIIYWGTLDLDNYQIAPQGSIQFSVPWPTDQVRHISDIKVDPAGTLYITSATDPGNDGPFNSAVYIAGIFTVDGSEFEFRANSQLAPIYRFDDYKIEAIELIPGANGGVIFGTDDENRGSSIYTSF